MLGGIFHRRFSRWHIQFQHWLCGSQPSRFVFWYLNWNRSFIPFSNNFNSLEPSQVEKCTSMPVCCCCCFWMNSRQDSSKINKILLTIGIIPRDNLQSHFEGSSDDNECFITFYHTKTSSRSLIKTLPMLVNAKKIFIKLKFAPGLCELVSRFAPKSKSWKRSEVT